MRRSAIGMMMAIPIARMSGIASGRGPFGGAPHPLKYSSQNSPEKTAGMIAMMAMQENANEINVCCLGPILPRSRQRRNSCQIAKPSGVNAKTMNPAGGVSVQTGGQSFGRSGGVPDRKRCKRVVLSLLLGSGMNGYASTGQMRLEAMTDSHTGGMPRSGFVLRLSNIQSGVV